MLKTFLDSLQVILPNEEWNYNEIKGYLIRNPFVAIMPELELDTWPAYVLQSTSAMRFAKPNQYPHLYIVPVGARNYQLKRALERYLFSFYEKKEQKAEVRLYGARLVKTILLKSGKFAKCLELGANGRPDAVLAEYELKNHARFHVLWLLDTPERIWAEVIEKFDIPTNYLIDLVEDKRNPERSEFYRELVMTKKPNLLPMYYFKGSIVSSSAPEGFVECYQVPELDHDGGLSEIYRANWQMR